MTYQPDLVTISKMVEDNLQVYGEVRMMDCRPSQRSGLDIVMLVRQKGKQRGKKKTSCRDSSSSRMDVHWQVILMKTLCVHLHLDLQFEVVNLSVTLVVQVKIFALVMTTILFLGLLGEMTFSVWI